MKISLEQIRKGLRYLKHYGIKEFMIRLKEKGEPEQVPYEVYYDACRVTEKRLNEQRRSARRWKDAPRISVVVLSPDLETLGECAQGQDEDAYLAQRTFEEELSRQSYENWEAVAAPSVRKALEQASGDYLLFVEPGDTLEPDALYELAAAVLGEGAGQGGVHWEKLPEGKPQVIYTDEDEITAAQEGAAVCYGNPRFKPDYSPDFLSVENCYIHHGCAVSQELVRKVLEETDAAGRSLCAFLCACAGEAEYIYHIPKALYHALPEHALASTANDGTLRRSDPADGTLPTDDLCHEVQQPLVSILIPNKDEKESLEQCLRSVARSTYGNYEVIVIENNSVSEEIFTYYDRIQEEDPKVRVYRWGEHGFNYSAINNFGASHARGEYLVFLNNDIELLTPDWLERMLISCRRPDVAAVGARLYYPDDTVQHAGIVVGIGGHARGIAANMCAGMPRSEGGYMDRARLRQNMSAVTAACMMMKRSVFREVGGFEEELRVAFNDVELCLKARKAGYLIVYEPSVEAYHYESRSRGSEDTPEKAHRFQQEIEYMREHWNDILRYGDPYYNPNLTPYRTDYSLRNP